MEQKSLSNSLDLSKLFNINPGTIKDLSKVGLDINLLYILECIELNILLVKCTKIEAWKTTLIRKGYITDKGELSALAKDILLIVRKGGSCEVMIKEKKELMEDDFTIWWKAFPGHDGFEINHREFSKTRGLRTGKDTCRELFLKLVSSGEYTAQQIIKATAMDVQSRKKASLKEGKNKLSYLQNSETYLRQKSFDGFVDEIEEESNSNKTIDI